jgi:hypothetical protein
MTNIREKIENNVVVWMLGTLLTGFLAGIGTYKGALEIMNLETIGKERLKQLENAAPLMPIQGRASEFIQLHYLITLIQASWSYFLQKSRQLITSIMQMNYTNYWDQSLKLKHPKKLLLCKWNRCFKV